MEANYSLLEQHVNLPDLLARIEDDRELLAELFLMFQEEFPVLQDALHCAMEAGDLSEAARAAHALKGMFANLSMKQGASLAATLEGAAHAGDLPKVKETLAAFDSETMALSAAMGACLEDMQQ